MALAFIIASCEFMLVIKVLEADSNTNCRFTSKIAYLQVVLFEGWMLGYEPQDNEAVTAVDPQVNCLMAGSRISVAGLWRN